MTNKPVTSAHNTLTAAVNTERREYIPAMNRKLRKQDFTLTAFSALLGVIATGLLYKFVPFQLIPFIPWEHVQGFIAAGFFTGLTALASSLMTGWKHKRYYKSQR